ncbi:GNAT family N-acetyltransferase [Actinospica robiniae]|uniref:GNAT family N-acetyltransferase n=1 Tax=Actinospica robiniae TaxID=304901 RepID=UPI000405F9A9|nr:GNAT family N-acetyltransferase [Actinospica robiniae]
MTRATTEGAATPAIISPSRRDAPVLGHTIATAFHSLPASQYLVPDPERRRNVYGAYFRLAVEDALEQGTVYAIGEGAAVALWMPVPAEGLPEVELDHRLTRIDDLAERDFAFHQALHARHPFDRGAHQWLMILAVRPGRQGQGLGSLLLDAHHDHLASLDPEQRVGTYLEAASMRARDFYRSRHGYFDVGDPIELPNRSLMYPMWREPHSATS